MWCFFFFKQKTAYEMRISDWSSDVCSSDLLSPDGGDPPPSDANDRLLSDDRDQSLSDGSDVEDRGHQDDDDDRQYDPEDADKQHEIGRESGRERVCQYV